MENSVNDKRLARRPDRRHGAAVSHNAPSAGMMKVEDAVRLLARGLWEGWLAADLRDEWWMGFIQSVAARVESGAPLTTEQGRIILRGLGRAKTSMLAAGVIDAASIDTLLENPSYRLDPRVSIRVPREARLLGDNLIALRFKIDHAIIAAIKNLSAYTLLGASAKPRFDPEHRIWVVPLTRENREAVIQIMLTHNFHIDPALVAYIDRASREDTAPSAFALDAEAGAIVGYCTNEIVGLWAKHVAGGQPA